jgi:hypothetical protein
LSLLAVREYRRISHLQKVEKRERAWEKKYIFLKLLSISIFS